MAKSAAEMIEALQAVRRKIPDKVEDIILLSKDVKEAKIDEFERGVKPDGSRIGRYRNGKYSMFKNRLNPRAGLGNVDLISSTYFSRTLFPYKRGKNRYMFGFQASYGNDLVIKYGADILGLNQDTFNDIQRFKIVPELISFIKKEIGQ